MTAKHSFVDDYPYLAYSSDPYAVQANASDIAGIETEIDALDGRLDAIEADNWVTTARIKDGAVTPDKLAPESEG